MSEVEYIGPFSHHEVIVRGWRVPFLTAEPLEDGGVCLSLDHRFALKVSLNDEAAVVPFVADCIAVALGYTSHPHERPNPSTPYGRLRPIGGDG